MHEVLSNITYTGDFYFNRVCNKTGEKKPKSEWIHMVVPVIIEQATYELQKELDELDKATARLYEAVEKGLLPLDQTLQVRSEKLKAQREELLSKMNRFGRRRALPEIQAGQVANFCKALRDKLLDRSSGFGNLEQQRHEKEVADQARAYRKASGN